MNDYIFYGIEEFDWDHGNIDKNKIKHGVSREECEDVFFHEPLFTFISEKNATAEKRYFLLGETNSNRRLFIVFTIREDKVRIISARDMSKNERLQYEKLKKNTLI